MAKPNDLVQGTLDLLRTVSLEPKHGWAIAKRIQQISGEVLQVQQGSLYPALHRLEQRAWIKAKWKETKTGRKAKFIEGSGELESLVRSNQPGSRNDVGVRCHVVGSAILAQVADFVRSQSKR